MPKVGEVYTLKYKERDLTCIVCGRRDVGTWVGVTRSESFRGATWWEWDHSGWTADWQLAPDVDGWAYYCAKRMMGEDIPHLVVNMLNKLVNEG